VLRQAEVNAITDALTGLGNRHWMQEMFNRELARAQRGGHPLCLIMVDVDQFKHVNDQFGHIAGDRILAAVADALRDRLRPSDLIARFGGDEFAILLPGADLGQACATAERLREHVERSALPASKTRVTISVGITRATGTDMIDSLVHRADSAMYAAKAAGRNRVMSR